MMVLKSHVILVVSFIELDVIIFFLSLGNRDGFLCENGNAGREGRGWRQLF